MRSPQPTALAPANPDRVQSDFPVRCEGPVWSRMRRAFAFHSRLTPEGRDLVKGLLVVPGALFVAVAAAMMLAPMVNGVPA